MKWHVHLEEEFIKGQTQGRVEGTFIGGITAIIAGTMIALACTQTKKKKRRAPSNKRISRYYDRDVWYCGDGVRCV